MGNGIRVTMTPGGVLFNNKECRASIEGYIAHLLVAVKHYLAETLEKCKDIFGKNEWWLKKLQVDGINA